MSRDPSTPVPLRSPLRRGPSKQYAFRLSDELFERIEAYRARLQAEMPHHRVTRSWAVRMLLVHGCDAEHLFRSRR